MEDFPQAYVDTASPLVILSGLGDDENANQTGFGQDSGARIITESPECRTEQASRLLQQFVALGGNRYAAEPSGNIRCKIKCIGRHYTLPARKSAPIANQPGAEGIPIPRSTELHSPLSPLSPGSPVFPDGLFSPAWFLKHQYQVPCLLLTFFSLNSGEGSSQDERTKSDINAVRSALLRSGFKTRFAAVLISDASIIEAPEMEERLASMKRATNLDSKGLYFMPPMSSQAEIASFVHNIMATMQPSYVEYYRDLTKHSRRKKARGGPSPQASLPVGGASHSTSTSGWNVRYDVKMGVFAEFRGEMDVAERHFSAAIEELFSSEGGVLETTANWSPRWDEARMLSDSIALRLIRCQLWTGQTSGAAQSWQNYKVRMQDLIDRRGKGSLTYGWSAWEARWANIMSQLIQLAEIPTLQKSLNGTESSLDITARQVYALPEKGIAPSDRLPPFNFLHHSGYWLRLFAMGIRNRWTRALAIPDEDRVPPGQSPASTVANRFVTYDTYLVPEPHEEMPLSGQGSFDHVGELGMVCIRAVEEFEARRQIRLSEQIRLELAEDYVRVGRYSDGLSVLIPLWEESTWREDKWVTIFARVLHLLVECIKHSKSASNAALIPILTWELLSIGSLGTPEQSLDMAGCLDDWESHEHVSIHVQDKQRRSPVSVAFAFKDILAHVGEAFGCQLVLENNGSETSPPLQISSLEFSLGETKSITIRHEAGIKDAIITPVSAVALHETDDGNLQGSADLTLQASQKRILDLSIVMRTAQIFSLTELSLRVKHSRFTFTHSFAEDSIIPSSAWYFEQDGDVNTVLIPHMDTKSIDVRPKPPKMQVLLPGLRKQCYCDENMVVPVTLINEECEAVQGTVISSIVSEAGDTFDVSWAPHEEAVRTISKMEPSTESSADLLIKGPPEAAILTLTLILRYHLLSDHSTPLEKTLTVELAFVHPFETSFAFNPRLHSDPWPSYFDSAAKDSEDAPEGIIQLWQLEAHVASSVDHALTINNVELVVDETQGDCNCGISEKAMVQDEKIQPKEKTTPTFELTTRKLSLDDRRPSYLFSSLVVHWSHDGGSGVSTTTITVPRLTIPTAEPRVLCVARNTEKDTVTLEYHLENPSIHFLTFALSMEASESFAFSGPKSRALSLAPLSRHQVDYQLVVHQDIDTGSDDAQGFWITPNLSVVDSFYNKSLRVQPGGPGVELNGEKQISVWIEKLDETSRIGHVAR
ncbi:uncharacterized protein RCC_10286 [Ramularia collo-cygni]|uniref:Trafficking protein particle complex subunit 11 domain-containing protein n=1 Tax=Ramularia collo-cygni TaxID=112498 RepID=A0A2D3VJI9_9PEZI|nr:uncharacterized protein RCC_10286 [Ramularia collo-cygni]CZT24561.1 uncharacterized protein RCC_10286 [Ramularia collo-cygni]